MTTTPRPAPLLKRIRGLEGLEETRGRTIDNLHLPEAFLAVMETSYGGTRLGRQELDGELIEDIEGALWTRATIEACRRPPRNGRNGDSPQLAGLMKRVAVGVDPPASAAGTCGISVCGISADGLFYVLADLSEAGLSPAGWAAKVARAEPVAMLFEQGEARFAGRFPALEDELAGLVAGGRYEGPGPSPDRADDEQVAMSPGHGCAVRGTAHLLMVWAMTALMKPRAEPSVRGL